MVNNYSPLCLSGMVPMVHNSSAVADLPNNPALNFGQKISGMKNIAITLLVAMLTGIASQNVIAQITTKTTQNTKLSDVKVTNNAPDRNLIAPHMPDSNDPNYASKKEQWVASYPDEYAKVNALSMPAGKYFIDKNEFEKLPAYKKNDVLAHPEMYQIGDDKTK